MVGAAKQSRHQRKSSVAASVAAMSSPRGLPSEDTLAALAAAVEEEEGSPQSRALPVVRRAGSSGVPAASAGAPFRLPAFPTGK